MEFPMLVYRCPGPHSRQGGTYDHVAVANEDELIARMESGWYETVPEAVAAFENPPVAPVATVPAAIEPPPVAVVVDQVGPIETAATATESPSIDGREELETQATELGLKFDGRNSDATLKRMIDEALTI